MIRLVDNRIDERRSPSVSVFMLRRRLLAVSAEGIRDRYDSGLPSVDEDLGNRLRQRDHVFLLQPVRRVDPRERRQVLEHVDEDVILEARWNRDSFRVLRANDFHPLRFFLRNRRAGCGGRRQGGFYLRGRERSPKASARLFARRPTMLSKRRRSWAG